MGSESAASLTFARSEAGEAARRNSYEPLSPGVNGPIASAPARVTESFQYSAV